MTPEQISQAIETLGLPTFFTMLAAYVFIKLVNVGFADHAQAQELAIENHKELVSLRKQNAILVIAKDRLERKYTQCREELKELQGASGLSDYIKQDAINDLLDDTVSLHDIIASQHEQIQSLNQELERYKSQGHSE